MALSVSNVGDATVNANAGDVIVVFISALASSPITVSSVSLTVSGLSFTKRAAITPFGSGVSFILEEWFAVAPTPIITDSWNITYGTPVSFPFQTYASIGGANTSTPFDVNGALPALGSNMTAAVAPSLPVSTTNANTIILSFLLDADAAGPPSPAAGFTTISSGGSSIKNDSEYKIVSATQSSFSVTWGAADTNAGGPMGMIADAVQAAAGGSIIRIPDQYDLIDQIRHRRNVRRIPI